MSAFFAQQLIEEYEIKEPIQIDLERIAVDLEITIEEDALDGCDGMLQMVLNPKCGIITVKRSIREPGQKRFVIAHELGHFYAPAAQSQDYQCGLADMSPNNQRIRPQEKAANEFAAELLMPEKLFVPMLARKEPNLGVVKELAREFRTTLTATLWRFIQFTDDRCALILSENGGIKFGKASRAFKFRLPHDIPLSPDSIAVDFFREGHIDDRMHSVLASAWITDSRISPHACIREQSISQPSYNSVLTLLWIDKDIDGFHSIDEDDGEEPDEERDLDHFTPDGKRWRW
jgi:Zn-dependent peptidase ImmA (M78 family)